MEAAGIIKTTQQQAVAAWEDYLNQLRLDELMRELLEQGKNFKNALESLEEIRKFIAFPKHILGNIQSKHGEIAEYMQVYISNARRYVEGLEGEYTFDDVQRLAPEDYLRNGIEIQSKFWNGPANTFRDIIKHLEKYPEFMKNGGEYVIPKDQYEIIRSLLKKSASQLNKKEYTLVQNIKAWEIANDVTFEDKIKPGVVTYADTQIAVADSTVDKEKANIEKIDKNRRREAYRQSRPSLKQGVQAAAVSAAAEGGTHLCLCVVRKLRNGKKLNEFTGEDWREVGFDMAKGTGQGAIRGAGIYGLTNFTATPAAVASSFVTAVFGVSAQIRQLQEGNISEEEFIVNSEVICLEVGISAVSALMGQALIPIPVLGAVIGNAVGMFLYGICGELGSKREKKLTENLCWSLELLNMRLDEHYLQLVEALRREFKQFASVAALAFDLNVNLAFAYSITLAGDVGVSADKILKNKKEVDRYFRCTQGNR